MTRTLTIIRALGAAVALLALVFGAPVLLASFGNPIGEVLDAFRDELASDASRSEALLTAALVIVGWIAWVMVVVAIVNEIVAAARGRMSGPLPLLPGLQAVARTLVTSVTLVTTLLSTTQVAAPLSPTPPASALADTDAMSSLSSGIEAGASEPTPVPTGPTYRVVRSDTWWSMAERLLGSGSRWQDIVSVNEGQRMVDGAVVTAATASPRPGWIVQLPSDAVLPLDLAEEPDEAEPLEVAQHVVVDGDTLWDIAVARLPTGTPPEQIKRVVAAIVDGNRSTVQDDGRTLTDPNLLEPGWTLSVPSLLQPPDVDTQAADTVVVERGDTLWDLAEDYLDAGERYPEIVDRNLGVTQPDGNELEDPDLILPGWRLDMPTSEPAAAETAVDHDQPPVPDAPETDSPDDTVTAPPSTTPVEAPAPRPPDLAPAPLPRPAPTSSQVTDDPPAEVDQDGSAVPVGLLTAGLATAGVVTLLDRRRRVQRQRRRSGHVLPTPTSEAERVEVQLRTGTDVDGAERIALAMQAAAAGFPGGTFPAVRFVSVSGDEVRAYLGEVVSPAPAGFDEVEGTWVTTLSNDQLEALAQGGVDPLPLLCPVGRTPDGSDVLIDLEQHGIAWIEGPQDRTMGLVRSMALALASSAWASSPQVIAVGMAGGIAELDWVDTTPTLVEGLTAICRKLPTNPMRRSSMEVDTGDPIVVVSGTTYWEVHKQQIEEISAETPSGNAVVILGPSLDGTGSVITIGDDGRIDCPGVDIDVYAAALADDDIRVIVDLLEETAQLDTDVPAPSDLPVGVRPFPTLADELQNYDILVRVMGEVTVERLTGEDDPQLLRFERARSQEAAVYLAAREEGRGVATEDVRAALWPDGRAADQTVRNTMTGARNGLGDDDDEIAYLPQPVDGRYHLSDSVVTDFELFWSLRQTASEIDDPDLADHLLDQALQLVRGEPFLGAGRGYAWTSSIGTTIIVAVVDVAEQVGLSRLTRDDPRGAERAARAGLTISPGEERLYRILLRAAAAQDSKPMVERLYREMLDVLADPDLGIEPEATVSDETVGLFNELVGGRRRTA